MELLLGNYLVARRGRRCFLPTATLIGKVAAEGVFSSLYSEYGGAVDRRLLGVLYIAGLATDVFLESEFS